MNAGDLSEQSTSNTSRPDSAVTATGLVASNCTNGPNGNQPGQDEDDETDDEYCVYTYKGDSRAVADLPSSFFTFDQGDLSSADESCGASALPPTRRRPRYNGLTGFNQETSSTATTHHQASNGSVVTVSRSRVNGVGQPAATSGDLFSPDMDFLEMDFDPGGFGDDEDDYHSDSQDGPAYADINQSVWNFGLGQQEEPMPGTSSCVLPAASTCPPCHEEVDVTDGPNVVSPTPGTNQIHKSPKTTSRSPGPSKSTKSSETIITSTVTPPCSSRIPVIPNPALSPESIGCSKTSATQFEPGSSHLNPQLLLGPPEPNSSTRTPSRHLMMRLVKSSTLPEMRSQSVQEVSSSDERHEVITREGSPRISRKQCFSNSDPLIKNEPLPCYRAVINTSPKSATEDDSIELEVGGVMIWSEEEACQRGLTQIGTSACGATAVCNVLKALGFDQIDSSYVNFCVKTRLRANEAEIPEYLFSRSVAGATHEDLLQGAIQVSNGLVNGRFFQPKPGIDAGRFCKWLLHWICKGAVPVVTRNMQILTPGQVQEGQQIPDAWHHQMIFGISPDKIFLTNPIERESPSAILPQLTSPSVLLVRRSDILERKRPTTDLRRIMRHTNPDWNELNVLGQVANILLEEIPVFSSNSIAKRIRTTHVTIPAGYKGGVTLFMPTNSPFFPLLLVAPDL